MRLLPTIIAFLLKKDYPLKMDHQPSFLYWQSLTAQHVDCRGHPSAAAISCALCCFHVVRAATKPTYLKAPGDGMVVAAGFGMLTLALMRLAAGYTDMAYGVNKVGRAGVAVCFLSHTHPYMPRRTLTR